MLAGKHNRARAAVIARTHRELISWRFVRVQPQGVDHNKERLLTVVDSAPLVAEELARVIGQ